MRCDRAAAGHGRRQRHARLVLRRRPATSTTTPRSPTASSWSPRAPTSSTSAASRPVPGAEPVAGRRGAAPGACRSSRRWRRTCGSRIDTRKRRGRRGGDRRRRHPGQRRVGVAPRGRRRGRTGGRLGRHAHAGRPAHDAGATRATTTSSPRCATSSSSGPTPPATRACDEVWIDPGIGFGKTPRTTWSLLRHLDVLVATGLSGRRRHQPQALPRRGRWPRPTARRRAPSRSTTGSRARWPPPCGRWCKASAMVRVHDVRATVHAATVVAG